MAGTGRGRLRATRRRGRRHGTRAAPNSTRAPGVSSTGSDARQARAGSGDGVSYGRAVVRRVCGHVARRLAYQRGQVCQERLAIEFPAVPAALPAPECHVPRSPFRREATITARAARPDAAPTDRVVGLSPLQIQRRFTDAARAAGIEARLTAHSGRVGLASELTARGASTTEVMLAGNWKTARMVAHYSAGATAERGAVRKYL